MLNTWRLQLLVQFETLGTMHRVAEVMYISTATVSQQLNLLEKETNTILFEKIGRRVQLTHAGRALVEQVKPVLNQLELIKNSLSDTSDVIQGTVRIASFSSALRAIVIPAVSKLSKRFPQLQIRLSEMEPDGSLPALDSHQFDLAVVAYFEKPHSLKQNDRRLIKLGTDRLMVLVGDENPLIEHPHVSIDELIEENWVIEPDGTYLSEYTKNLCRTAGFQPNVMNIFQSYSSIQTVVAQNLAIGILPKLAVTEQVDGVHLLNLQPELTRHIYLVARRSQATLRSIQIVTEAINEQSRHVFTDH
ncbi:LysR substrate-binding domain-containing protein [Niallia sp. 03190]|uniref:LysR substrate-binding domain-containing protein n=1 Tax=Niallia sp. 03190 TaxID=3458061 RepID=UPI004043FA79